MTADAQLIRSLEEISTNALPCKETLYYDGWILRFAGSYPRRANSVHPFYGSTLPVEEKIDYCERQYWARGWRTVFKITPAWQDELVAPLEARGYEEDALVGVHITDALPVVPVPSGIEVELLPSITPAWLADKQRLNDFTDLQAGSYAAILTKLTTPAAFVRVCRDGQVVALAMAVVEREWMGLYSLITDSTARRQGLAMALIGTLFEWARGQGASRAYLQVAQNNAPALALYDRLGFRYAYRYWYLQKSPPENAR